MALRLEESSPSTPERFDEFYAEFAPRVRTLIRRRVRNPHQVDDLVQETFLRAHQSASRYDATRPAWPWLATIAINATTDAARRQRVRREQVGDAVDVAGDADASDLYIGAERRRAIATALHELPERQRRVLLLREVDALHYHELATLEGVTVDAVKSILKRARQSFRHAYTAMASERGLLGAGITAVGALKRALARLSLRLNDARGLPDLVGVGVAAVLATVALGASPSPATTAATAGAAATNAVGRVAAPRVATPPADASPPASAVPASRATPAVPRETTTPVSVHNSISTGSNLTDDHTFRVDLPAGYWFEFDGSEVTSCTFNAARQVVCSAVDQLPHEVDLS